jgi:hypothetical protein
MMSAICNKGVKSTSDSFLYDKTATNSAFGSYFVDLPVPQFSKIHDFKQNSPQKLIAQDISSHPKDINCPKNL